MGGGYCRLQMPLTLAPAVKETVAGRKLGALKGAGATSPPFPMHRSGRESPGRGGGDHNQVGAGPRPLRESNMRLAWGPCCTGMDVMCCAWHVAGGRRIRHQLGGTRGPAVVPISDPSLRTAPPAPPLIPLFGCRSASGTTPTRSTTACTSTTCGTTSIRCGVRARYYKYQVWSARAVLQVSGVECARAAPQYGHGPRTVPWTATHGAAAIVRCRGLPSATCGGVPFPSAGSAPQVRAAQGWPHRCSGTPPPKTAVGDRPAGGAQWPGAGWCFGVRPTGRRGGGGMAGDDGRKKFAYLKWASHFIIIIIYCLSIIIDC